MVGEEWWYCGKLRRNTIVSIYAQDVSAQNSLSLGTATKNLLKTSESK